MMTQLTTVFQPISNIEKDKDLISITLKNDNNIKKK